MSQLNWVVVALFSVFLFIATKAIEVVIEKEYTSWSAALARLWVRGAGFISRSHREQWWADLQYQQHVEGVSGLGHAMSCLVSAPVLALRDTASRARGRTVATLKLFVDPSVFRVDSHRDISELGLSSRTTQMLRNRRVATVDQLLSMKEEELFQIRNFGRRALDEVKEKLVEGGFVQPEEMGPV